MKRKYKSGTAWCVWRWTYTPSGYITRLHLIKTPWFAIMLHWINGPDPEPHMHDHPVSFLSIILRGGYDEYRQRVYKNSHVRIDMVRWIKRKNYNFIEAGWDIHRIVKVKPNTLTLCFVGPKTREWGFHTENGWVPWKEYNQKYQRK